MFENRSMNGRRLIIGAAIAVAAGAVPIVSTAAPVRAAATYTTALYEMNEPAGSRTLVDSSGNNLNGTIGTEVQTNATYAGATGHRYAYLAPDTPPAHPQHLDKVNDNTMLDPGTSDFAVTVRYRTTRSFGNLIQKGQNADAGGYFKIELPAGNITCLFKDATGRQRAMTTPRKYNDGQWHVIRCERYGQNQITLYVDGVRISRIVGSMTNINNTKNLSIAGKSACDQRSVSCDYFVGDIDYVRIEKGSSGPVANTPPTARFAESCVGLTCTFDAGTSTDPGGSIAGYSWNFGSGAGASGVAPTKTFATAGTYNVSLTVTDNLGATNTTSHPVTVVAPNAAPTARFTSACSTTGCVLDGTASSDPEGAALTYAWTIDDVAAGTTPTISPALTPGQHSARLTVTDPVGATGAVTHEVSVQANEAPIAAFTSSCAGLVCTFDASTSADVNGNIVSRTWDFGDGTGTVEGVVVQHTFGAAADYAVTLVVADSDSLSGEVTQVVTVVDAPVGTIAFVGQTSVSSNATTHTAGVPADVEPGDALLMFFSGGTSPPSVGEPSGVAGWTLVDAVASSHGTTRVWRKVAEAGDAGAQVRVPMSALTKGNLTIVAYRGTSPIDPIATVARVAGGSSATRTTPTVDVAGSASWAVSYWMHRDSSSTSLTVPASVVPRATGSQTGGGRVTTLLADSNGTVPIGAYGGLSATAQASSSFGTAWTIILAPA